MSISARIRKHDRFSVAVLIRKAALGRTPDSPWAMFSWVKQIAIFSTRFFDLAYEFDYGSDTERRMFLLFVAEALESE